MKHIMIAMIRFYRRFLSPFFGTQCRFDPTCSAYGLRAYQEHGFFRGTVLTARRLLSCHPMSRRKWHDPVPPSITQVRTDTPKKQRNP
jgi:putative membrane protein insertion efficiency factor